MFFFCFLCKEIELDWKKMFRCENCLLLFNNKLDFDNHNALEHNEFKMFSCASCKKEFHKKYNLLRHLSGCNNSYTCSKCKHEFTNAYNGERHEEVCCTSVETKKFASEPTKDELLSIHPNEIGIVEYETAFENRLKSFFVRLN